MVSCREGREEEPRVRYTHKCGRVSEASADFFFKTSKHKYVNTSLFEPAPRTYICPACNYEDEEVIDIQIVPPMRKK
jgi:hypothetical protein